MLEEKRNAEATVKKEMAAARLGYAVLNLLNPGVKLVFGEYNNRAQNKKAVGELVRVAPARLLRRVQLRFEVLHLLEPLLGAALCGGEL